MYWKIYSFSKGESSDWKYLVGNEEKIEKKALHLETRKKNFAIWYKELWGTPDL